jgi:hypothetical protein
MSKSFFRLGPWDACKKYGNKQVGNGCICTVRRGEDSDTVTKAVQTLQFLS